MKAKFCTNLGLPRVTAHTAQHYASEEMTNAPLSEYRCPVGIPTCRSFRQLAIVFKVALAARLYCEIHLLYFSSGLDIGYCVMLSIMRADAKVFVNELVEQMYGDVDRIETQIVLNQQEDPLIVPVLLSIQKKMREFLRLVEEESVNLEEAAS
jgi:hypothetical protein